MIREEDEGHFEHPVSVSRLGVTSLNSMNYFLWSTDMEIIIHRKDYGSIYIDQVGHLSDSEMEHNDQNFDIYLETILMSIETSYKAFVITLRDIMLV